MVSPRILCNAIHAIEHGIHPELFRVNAAFLIDHRISQKPVATI